MPEIMCNYRYMSNSKMVFNTKEACEILGISRSAFSKLRKLGIFKPLPHIRRNQIYPFSQLLEFISQAPKSQGKQ